MEQAGGGSGEGSKRIQVFDAFGNLISSAGFLLTEQRLRFVSPAFVSLNTTEDLLLTGTQAYLPGIGVGSLHGASFGMFGVGCSSLGSVWFELPGWLRRVVDTICPRPEGTPHDPDPAGHHQRPPASTDEGTDTEQCPCSVRLYYVPVTQSSVNLSGAVRYVTTRPFYHTALKVWPQEKNCPWYIIELQGYVADAEEAKRVGQIKWGRAAVPSGFVRVFGPAYGIRKLRNGVIEDEHSAGTEYDEVEFSSQEIACEVAQCIVDNVHTVPTPPYGSDVPGVGGPWTSNSVPSFLLELCGVNARRLRRMRENFLTPGWEPGTTAGSQGRNARRGNPPPKPLPSWDDILRRAIF